MIRGVQVCVALAALGGPLALLGLVFDSSTLMALGGGAIATVVVGWPALLVMGALTPVKR